LVLGLTIAGFFGARALGERAARRDSEHRAEVAAAHIRGRVQQGTSLAESLRRFMVSGGAPAPEAFANNAARWLNPAGFPAAAWLEEVPAARRAAYERRTGNPIVTLDRRGRFAPTGARPAYLPATLVSGVPPMEVPGIDFAVQTGVPAALARASSLYDAGATPLMALRDGTQGLFLIKLAPRLIDGVVHPGFVVVFVSDLWLRAAAADAPALRLAVGGPRPADLGGAHFVDTTFSAAGQRFDVAVPLHSVDGSVAVLPWIILGAGLALAALAGALGVNAARRARAQEELDRIFTLSPDLITVADFDGHFTRVNPAVEQVLGYTAQEMLARPYIDLVHPDDRERTAAEAASIGAGKTAVQFENRFVRKDGSLRVLQWTTTPVLAGGVMYGMARDVTERREAEHALARIVDEQAALRRVATLVARGVPPAELFAAVAEEIRRQLAARTTAIGRFEPDTQTMVIVASSGSAKVPVGTRLRLDEDPAMRTVHRTGHAAQYDVGEHGRAPESVAAVEHRPGIRSSLAVPIMVEGSLWGGVSAGTEQARFPEDAERRMAEFTELAGTAIANAESRSELTASRARVVAASDKTRRKIERDLHDGAQQRLVHTVVTLKLARQALQTDGEGAPGLIAEALEQAELANVELRDLVQGILPSILTHGGLQPAVTSLAARMPVPVEIGIPVGRLPDAVEATAYFVVAEALTNVVKHSGASEATVVARVEDGALQVRVFDDGVGGAVLSGSGFVGLADRLAVLNGQLRIESPAGSGTLVAADIPLEK
jgi:PAS domain S-box-containing protein